LVEQMLRHHPRDRPTAAKLLKSAKEMQKAEDEKVSSQKRSSPSQPSLRDSQDSGNDTSGTTPRELHEVTHQGYFHGRRRSSSPQLFTDDRTLLASRSSLFWAWVQMPIFEKMYEETLNMSEKLYRFVDFKLQLDYRICKIDIFQTRHRQHTEWSAANLLAWASRVWPASPATLELIGKWDRIYDICTSSNFISWKRIQLMFALCISKSII